jgi:hypothetical protein
MKILTASLGALLVLVAAPARSEPTQEIRFNFTPVTGIALRDTGATGLEPGTYKLVFDRATAAPGDSVQAHLEPAGPGGSPIDRAVSFDGCGGGAETGYDAGELKLDFNFGAQSRTRVSARPDGGRTVRVWAEGNRRCSLSLVIPPAATAEGSVQPTTSAGPGGPGGLANPSQPQCSPPRFPPGSGSPQPAPLGPSLAATPISPPDGGCELTGYPLSAAIAGAPEPELRSALTELRRAIEALKKVPEDDTGRIASARAAIRRSLTKVARASRGGDRTELATVCESDRYQCEQACGERECCCCTATYANCLLER